MNPKTEERGHPDPPSILPDSGGTYEYVGVSGETPAALICTSPDAVPEADVGADAATKAEVAAGLKTETAAIVPTDVPADAVAQASGDGAGKVEAESGADQVAGDGEDAAAIDENLSARSRSKARRD